MRSIVEIAVVTAVLGISLGLAQAGPFKKLGDGYLSDLQEFCPKVQAQNRTFCEQGLTEMARLAYTVEERMSERDAAFLLKNRQLLEKKQAELEAATTALKKKDAEVLAKLREIVDGQKAAQR